MAVDRLYLDANVLIDLVLERSTYGSSAMLLSLAEESKVRLYTSPATISLIEYSSRKFYDLEYIQRVILGMLNQIELVSISQNMARKAVASPLTDIEDSLHYYTAIEHGCQYFISNDTKLAKKALEVLPVLSPGEYVRVAKIR